MKKKRNALLLELLIAISLLTVGLVGLIKSPVYLHRAAEKQFERAECNRLAAWGFTEIREQMAQGKMGWAAIPALQETSAPIVLQAAAAGSRSVKRSYVLSTLEQKQTTDGRIYRLVAVCITVGGHDFTYRVTVEKGPTSLA